MLDVVIFSKDRACQLELLLRSIKRFFAQWRESNVQVLYTFSTPEFARGYNVVRGEHPEFRYVCEQDRPAGFRELTLGLLGERPYLTFLVDDDVFKEPFSLDAPEFATFAEDSALMCLSLRMCPRMNYAYTLDRFTTIPQFERGTIWDWTKGDGDWGYPMSIDGHIFRSQELVPRIRALDFRDPNTFEDVLSRHPLPAPRAICLEESRIINLPVNRVQDTAPNRHGNVSAEWLNDEFVNGRRLSLQTVIGIRNPSPHHEVALSWEEPASADEREPHPSISVIIPCFNGADYLAEAIESVLSQTLQDIEVIVVDDGSTDESAAIAERLIAAHPEASIRLLRQPASGHPAYARNAGIALARGEYVLCLDADDMLTPTFLERCVFTLDTHREAGIAYTDQRDFGLSRKLHVVPEYDFYRLTRQNLFGVASVFRRQAWQEVGGFDPHLGYEDWDFWIACGERGHHGVKVPGVEWLYRVRGDGRFATDGVPHDRRTKAQMVSKRPSLYTGSQVAWASAVLANDPSADAFDDRPGVIPELVAGEVGAAGDAGLRSFITVAAAEEVVRDAKLIAAYASQFGPEDDATLILYAPHEGPDDLLEQLVSVISATGVDGPDGPHLTALSVSREDGDSALLGSAHAILSDEDTRSGVYARLPRFSSESIADLRARAERSWRRAGPAHVVPVGARGLEVPPDMEWAYADGRHYERNVVERFEQLLAKRTDGAVYDIGANCGYFSILAAGSGAPVYSFEPVPETFDVLRRNRARNQMPSDGAFCLAISDQAGVGTMHLYSSSGNNSLYARNLPSGHLLRCVGQDLVDVTTLDDCVERFELTAPAVIKIDVEGAELHVLRGGRRTLKQHRPDLIIEYGESTCRDAGYARQELLGELLSLGYTIWGLSEDPDDLTLYPAERLATAAIGSLVASVKDDLAGHDLDPVAAVSVPGCVAHRPAGWDWYVQDLAAYRSMPGGEGTRDEDLIPQLGDRTPANPYDGHYFFQDVWAARRIADRRPARHVDVGSRVDYVGFVTAITDVVFVDIRPLEVEIENLECVTGSVLNLPFTDRSLDSVSCLHVAEHIGLGRYGDPLNPSGTREAAAELQRVIAPGGQLLFSVPVGRPRTCFNAHRIFDPCEVPHMFPELLLVEFAGVDDSIVFRRHRLPEELAGSEYACGMYLFRRPEREA